MEHIWLVACRVLSFITKALLQLENSRKLEVY